MKAGTVLADRQLPNITREMVTEFAQASNDLNPIHMDSGAARSAGHKDVIVHGMYVMALLGNELLTLVSSASLRSFSTRFVAVTPVNSALRVEIKVADTAGSLESDTTKLDLVVSRQDEVRVVVGAAIVDTAALTGRTHEDKSGEGVTT
jgi:acyl dehydratase